MSTLTTQLLWTIAQVTIIGSVAGGLYLAFGKRFSNLRGQTLTVCFGLIILLSGLALSPWPNWRVGPDAISSAVLNEVPPSSASNVDGSPESDVPTRSEVDWKSPSAAFLQQFVSSLASSQEAPSNSVRSDAATNEIRGPGPSRSLPWFPIVLLTLAAIRVLFLAGDYFRLHRFLRRSCPLNDERVNELLSELQSEADDDRRIALRVTSAIGTGAATGWLRPTILLSDRFGEWTDEQLRGVLAHELGHLRHCDGLRALLCELALSLHSYHPLLYWLRRRFRLEQEFQADTVAARSVGGETSYLRVLAELALRQDAQTTPAALPTFLNSKSPLLRRIDMLRKPDRHPNSRPLFSRFLVPLLLLLGIGVAGLRMPTTDVAEAASPQGEQDYSKPNRSQTADRTETINPLKYVPESTYQLLTFNVAKLRTSEQVRKLMSLLDEEDNFKESMGFSVGEVSMFQQAFVPDAGGPGIELCVIVRTRTPVDEAAWKTAQLPSSPEPLAFGQHSYYRTRTGSYASLIDPKTILIADSARSLKLMAMSANLETPPTWKAKFQKFADRDIHLFGRVAMMRPLFAAAAKESLSTQMAIFTPLYENTEFVRMGLTIDGQMKFQMIAESATKQQAAVVQQTLAFLKILGGNGVKALRTMPEGAPFADGLQMLVDNLTIKQDESSVEVTTALEPNQLEQLVRKMIPAVTEARVAAKRAQSMNNMKQIALALHNYYSTFNHLPPAVLTGPDGKTKYSWRVEILPFLEEQELYDEYRKDEPWNSEHNKTVLAKMPSVFHHPMDSRKSTNAGYFAIVGKRTVIRSSETSSFRDVTDGLSNTIWTTSAKRDIPWTKPEDIPFDEDNPLPKLGGFFEEGYEVGLGDGSVRFLSKALKPEILRLLLMRDDGQPIGRDDL